MYETDEDLEALQALLDRSYAAAGPHLVRIHNPDRRADAAEVASRLAGMRLLVLGTVSAAGRPVVGPVDGIFYRGAFHFASAPDSTRMRHIRARPHVSATHLPGEAFAVTVHGTAEVVDLTAPVHAGLRRTLLEIYTPRYGAEWEAFMDAATYARIDAARMFAFRLPDGE
jgi:nitroimidazol reductase NimA-like FMN-containing flavoprotein (pyridoxamine 5'-phosphate oxidase superfamily)